MEAALLAGYIAAPIAIRPSSANDRMDAAGVGNKTGEKRRHRQLD